MRTEARRPPACTAYPADTRITQVAVYRCRGCLPKLAETHHRLHSLRGWTMSTTRGHVMGRAIRDHFQASFMEVDLVMQSHALTCCLRAPR